jgi:hypothetical protein
MEKELKGIVAANSVPAVLIVTYDDMHGLWGGTTIIVRGDGSLERRTRPLGAPEAEVTRKQVGGSELLDFVRLLVELEAWEQRTADEQPVADESRAHLTISAGINRSTVWERVGEMRANDRLLRIKSRLMTL